MPFSVSLVCDLVGLPEEGRDRLLPWARLGFDSWGPLGPRSEAAAFGYQCLVNYSDTVSVPEHLEPGRWGAGIYDAVDRGDMEPDAIHGVVFAYLQAGMDTTVNAIGSALYLFAQHPDQWDLVRREPELIPSAVNEVLRYHSPIQRYTRVANDDIEVGGVRIPADSRVVALIGVGQPRRATIRRSRPLRRDPQPDRPPRLRSRHPPLRRSRPRQARAERASHQVRRASGALRDQRPRVGDQRHHSRPPLPRSHDPSRLTQGPATIHVRVTTAAATTPSPSPRLGYEGSCRRVAEECASVEIVEAQGRRSQQEDTGGDSRRRRERRSRHRQAQCHRPEDQSPTHWPVPRDVDSGDQARAGADRS